MFAERRRHPRLPITLRVDLYTHDTTLRGCLIKDISRQGLFILTDNALQVGTNCCADLWLEGAEPPVRISLKARVVRLTPTGVGLDVLGPEDVESFQHWVRLVSYNSLNLEPRA